MANEVETYTCANCGNEFKKGWSDKEAKAELDEVFDVPVEDCALVCDSCYRLIMAQLGTQYAK